MGRVTVETRTYKAADEEGREHVIHVFEDVFETHTGGRTQRTPLGLQSHQLANGTKLSVGADGLLVDHTTGRKLRPI